MKILYDLGFNSTFYIELVLFLFCFTILVKFIFNPYLKAHHERSKRTVGDEEFAERITQEAAQKKLEYEAKAKTLNLEFRTVYDATKNQALQEYDRLLSETKKEVDDKLESASRNIANQVAKVRLEIEKEVVSVSNDIVNKIAGREGK